MYDYIFTQKFLGQDKDNKITSEDLDELNQFAKENGEPSVHMSEINNSNSSNLSSVGDSALLKTIKTDSEIEDKDNTTKNDVKEKPEDKDKNPQVEGKEGKKIEIKAKKEENKSETKGKKVEMKEKKDEKDEKNVKVKEKEKEEKKAEGKHKKDETKSKNEANIKRKEKKKKETHELDKDSDLIPECPYKIPEFNEKKYAREFEELRKEAIKYPGATFLPKQIGRAHV